MDQQEILTMPVWASKTLTVIALIFISVAVFSVVLHIILPIRFPSPEALGVEALAAIGVVTIFGTYFPWSKISFGGIEIERILEEQAREHAEDLRELLPNMDTPSNITDDGSNILNEVTFGHMPKQTSDEKESTLGQNTLSDNSRKKHTSPAIVETFLRRFPRWGFTANRILNWGSKQDGFAALSNFNRAQLHVILSDLVTAGKVNIRLSRSGNVLYQIDI